MSHILKLSVCIIFGNALIRTEEDISTKLYRILHQYHEYEMEWYYQRRHVSFMLICYTIYLERIYV